MGYKVLLRVAVALAIIGLTYGEADRETRENESRSAAASATNWHDRRSDGRQSDGKDDGRSRSAGQLERDHQGYRSSKSIETDVEVDSAKNQLSNRKTQSGKRARQYRQAINDDKEYDENIDHSKSASISSAASVSASGALAGSEGRSTKSLSSSIAASTSITDSDSQKSPSESNSQRGPKSGSSSIPLSASSSSSSASSSSGSSPSKSSSSAGASSASEGSQTNDGGDNSSDESSDSDEDSDEENDKSSQTNEVQPTKHDTKWLSDLIQNLEKTLGNILSLSPRWKAIVVDLVPLIPIGFAAVISHISSLFKHWTAITQWIATNWNQVMKNPQYRDTVAAFSAVVVTSACLVNTHFSFLWKWIPDWLVKLIPFTQIAKEIYKYLPIAKTLEFLNRYK